MKPLCHLCRTSAWAVHGPYRAPISAAASLESLRTLALLAKALHSTSGRFAAKYSSRLPAHKLTPCATVFAKSHDRATLRSTPHGFLTNSWRCFDEYVQLDLAYKNVGAYQAFACSLSLCPIPLDNTSIVMLHLARLPNSIVPRLL